MTSSISSFRGELKVLAAVLLALGAGEIAARHLAPALDSDRKHIAQFPRIANDLAAAKPPRILFLGNSLFLHGIDVDVVKAGLAKGGYPGAAVKRVTPVGTDMVDWIYLYSRYFARSGHVPDVVVLGFARHHFVDMPPKELERLGRHFIGTSDIPELFKTDVDAFGDRVQVLLSYSTAMMGDHLLYQQRIMDGIIPEYREGTRWVSHRLEERDEEQARRRNGGRETTPEYTFVRARRFAELLRASGAHGVFVPIPLPDFWTLPDRGPAVVRASGMTWLDGRTVPGLRPEHWYDGYHLSEEGAKIFSEFLGREIARDLTARAPGGR